MRTSQAQRLRLSLAALFAVPLMAVSLAGCSPTASDETGQTGGSSSAGDASDSMQWQLDYAACMREQGIDIEDPKPGGGLSTSTSQGTDAAALEAASKTCTDKLGEPPAPRPEEQQAADEQFLEMMTKAAECYREHGYDVPDPDLNSKSLNFPSDAPEDVVTECGGGSAVRTE